MLTSKQLPRFVPTLTEVVRPGAARTVQPSIDRERLIEQVLQAVKPRLEQQLRQALGPLIEEHIRKASPQWRSDIEATVESAVAQLLVHRPRDNS